MFEWFKPVPVYVKIYPDEIEMIHLKKGTSVRRSAHLPFSNERMIIANFAHAETLGRAVAKELGVWNKSLKILVQQMKVWNGELSELEKRALRDLCEQIGGRKVFIVTDDRRLTNEEALQLLNEF